MNPHSSMERFLSFAADAKTNDIASCLTSFCTGFKDKSRRSTVSSAIPKFILRIADHSRVRSVLDCGVTIESKSKFITRALDLLKRVKNVPSTYDDIHLDPQIAGLALYSLRILSREIPGCDNLFCDESIALLMHYCLFREQTTPMPNSARVDDIVPMEALRCLANVLLQNRSLQMYFDSMNGLEAALLQHEKSENLSMEAEFLICRLIFLSTADRKNWNMSTPIVPRIAAVLSKIISKFVVQVCETLPRLTNAKDAMWAGLIDSPVLTQEIVLGELWKAAFGVTALTSSNSTIDDRYNNPLWLDGEALECFAEVLKLTVRFLTQRELTTFHLRPPVNHAIHFLISFPADKCFTDCWFPDGDYNILDFLINTLDRALSIEPEAVQASADGSFFANSSDNVAPLMLILGNLARSSPKAKQIIETAILPPQIDRSLPIERSPTLTGRVVRLLSAVTPENVRHCTGDLLFVLCDLDPKTLVDRIGYGSAAGFLFQRGLLQESMGGIGGSKTPMSISAENDVELPYSLNPITGQVENGKSKENDDMTEEEKEEEAEKLFVLFDRLRKTGVVTVGLPAFST